MTSLLIDPSVLWVRAWNLNTTQNTEDIGIIIFANAGIGCDFEMAMRDRRVPMPLLVLCKLFNTVNFGLH